jgi:hypothetical protein
LTGLLQVERLVVHEDQRTFPGDAPQQIVQGLPLLPETPRRPIPSPGEEESADLDYLVLQHPDTALL